MFSTVHGTTTLVSAVSEKAYAPIERRSSEKVTFFSDVHESNAHTLISSIFLGITTEVSSSSSMKAKSASEVMSSLIVYSPANAFPSKRMPLKTIIGSLSLCAAIHGVFCSERPFMYSRPSDILTASSDLQSVKFSSIRVTLSGITADLRFLQSANAIVPSFSTPSGTAYSSSALFMGYFTSSVISLLKRTPSRLV